MNQVSAIPAQEDRPLPFLLGLIRLEARKRGLQFDPDLDFGHVAQLRFPDGTLRYILRNMPDLERVASLTLAGQKAASLEFLRIGGVPVAQFEVFEGKGLDLAEVARRADDLGYPIVLRPDGRGGGKGLRIVAGPEGLRDRVAQVLESGPAFLMQRWVRGKAYRVLVFEGRLVAVLEQFPLAVRGDGRKTVRELVCDLSTGTAGTPAPSPLVLDEGHIESFLTAIGRTLEDVPGPGEEWPVALAGYGPGHILDAKGQLPAEALSRVKEAARLSGLRLASVEGVISEAVPSGFEVLRVDAFSDLEHLAPLGTGSQTVFEDLIGIVFDVMGEATWPAGEISEPHLTFQDPLPPINFLAESVPSLALRLGIAAAQLPGRERALALTYPNRAVRHVLDEMTDINRAASVLVANQKPWSLGFLRRGGFHVPEFECFFADWLAQIIGTDRNQQAALAFARSIGFPVVVKPNDKRGGEGVFIAKNAEDFERFLAAMVAKESLFIVQRAVLGIEYRVVVLDGAVQITFQKHPLTVIGDGARTVGELLADRLDQVATEFGHAVPRTDDFRIQAYMAYTDRTLNEVPATGERVILMLNAGYGCGGYLLEAADCLPAAIARASIEATRHAGLRYSGIDIKGPASPEEPDYWILEVNTQPDLAGYSAIGPQQRQRTEALIAKLLVHIGHGAAGDAAV